MEIKTLDHYMISKALIESKRNGNICFREQSILDNFDHAEIEQQSGFKTAWIYDVEGNAFQIVVFVKDSHHKIGDITN